MSRNLQVPSPNIPRNVHIYDNAGTVLGGIWQNGSVLNSTLYSMCRIFINTDKKFALFRLNSNGSTGAKLFRNRTVLSAGLYIVLSTNGNPITATITDESALRRVQSENPSSTSSPRTESFADRVIARDNECVMTGAKLVAGNRRAFNVAHVFPRAREQLWIDKGFKDLITDTAPTQQQGENKINSVQNGLLLSATVHGLFDDYEVSANVDDGYKIICFTKDSFRIDGRTLGLSCRTYHSTDGVPDELLRWHFHQAILFHMKGAGEKLWDVLPDEGDMIREILEGPNGAERMELEMWTRLGAGEMHFSPSPEVGSS